MVCSSAALGLMSQQIRPLEISLLTRHWPVLWRCTPQLVRQHLHPLFLPKSSHAHTVAIIAYLSSFVLVKYNRISVPITEEGAIGSPRRDATTTSPGGTIKDPQSDHPLGLQSLGQQPTTGTFDPMITIERIYLRNFLKTRPPGSTFYASSAGPGTVTPPELQDAYTLLLRCNSVCVLLTFVGLLLAITGIMAYVWTTFTLVPGIFVSVCFIFSLVAGCYALR
jgi:hypothetical protein